MKNVCTRLRFPALIAALIAVPFMWPSAPAADPVQAVHIIGTGSRAFAGTCWKHESGLFVTALHVPTDEKALYIDGRYAEIVAISHGADLCLLRAKDIDGPGLSLGELSVGEAARVVGFVGDSNGRAARMQTFGHISSLSLSTGFTGYDGGIQPGLSGSPVLDASGRVLGVVSSASCWGGFMPSPNPTMGNLCPLADLRYLLAVTDPNAPALPIPQTPKVEPLIRLPDFNPFPFPFHEENKP